MKTTLICLLGILLLAFGAYWVLDLRKPLFPFEVLEIDRGTLSSSVEYNPYADYAPAHRWEIGLVFQKFSFGPDNQAYAPIVSFTLNLGNKRWQDLAGTYEFKNIRGSDFWHNDTNMGPVDLDSLKVESLGGSKFQISLLLAFRFAETGHRPQKKTFVFQTNYEGLRFIVPTWNNPGEVQFPKEWGVPSSKPQWSGPEIKQFVGRYVDLFQYKGIDIDQSQSETSLHGTP